MTDSSRPSLLLFLIICIVFTEKKCHCEYQIPALTLEAYTPSGFRASIPADDGVQLFAFHGVLNKQINLAQPGDFTSEVTQKENNQFKFFNPDLTLKVGDEVNYWVHVQRDKLGYRKNPTKWVVKELVSLAEDTCNQSISQISGKSTVCEQTVIFQDDFTKGPDVDEEKWIGENYIPTQGPDYEFVSYQLVQCSLEDGKLFIQPKAATSESNVRGTLDINYKCTRQTSEECIYNQQGGFILPPVTSGRIVSKKLFKYGEIEIKAKLPAGDWIYPEIYLEQANAPNRKLWIAYARGNTELLSASGEDIGSRLLFGGPVLNSQEPKRSTFLKSKRNSAPFTENSHVFVLRWEPNRIILKVDGEQYGEIDAKAMQAIKFDNDMVRLVLGVGVGGINDFPDNFVSGTVSKPWINKEARQVKKFFNARNEWGKTWVGRKAALQVDHVKITSL